MTWQYDAMQLIRLSGIGTPDNQLKGKVKGLVNMASMAGVCYFRFERSGETHVGVPKYSAYM
jgi:hypothetical protein